MEKGIVITAAGKTIHAVLKVVIAAHINEDNPPLVKALPNETDFIVDFE